MRKAKRILLMAGVLVLSVNAASAGLFRRSAQKSAPPQAQAAAETAAVMTLNAIELEPAPSPRVVLRTSASPAYTSYSPTPDTFVIDLSGAAKGANLTVPSPLPDSITAITAEDVMEMGTRLTRVTFRLSQGAALQAAPVGNSVSIALPEIISAAKKIEAPTTMPDSVPQVAEVPVIEPMVKTAELTPEPVVALPKAKTHKKVATSGSGNALEVQLAADGALTFKTSTLDNPSRLVIDLDGVKNKAAATVNVDGAIVKRIRSAQFQPTVTRVVVDLDRKTQYHVAKSGDHLVISFGEAAAVAASRRQPVEVKAQAAAVIPAAAKAADIPSQVPAIADNATWKMPAQTNASKGARSVIRSAQAAPPAPAPRPAAPRAPQPTGTPMTPTPSSNTENVFGDPQSTTTTTTTTPGAPTAMGATPTITGGLLGGTRFLSGAERTYTGEPISLNLKDADLKDVLRTFAQLTGLNMAIDPGITGSVTVDFVDVPWDQALDIILRQNGLSYVLEGNVMRIGTLGRLAAEAQATRALQEEEKLNVPLTTVSFKLSYARASDVMQLLSQIASPRGRLIVDTRTNQLIITEIPGYLQTMRNMIDSVDVPTRQVLIEARIVETSKRFVQQYGFVWGFRGSLDPALGTGTGLVFPNRVDVVGGQFNFGPGNPVLAFHLGDVLGGFTLDVALNAAESEGLVRIISAPRIVTQDNTAAQIQSGVQIPFQTRINFTTTIAYVDATLNLSVIPQITESGTVIMDIAVQKNEPATGLAIEGSAGTPIQTRQARTRLMVRDGGTSVIGGIYQSSDNNSQTRLPFLHQIPVLGNLFKTHNISNSHDELLIFITPRILRTS
jgi:type IV pilus assembly protein PilQ